MVRNSISVIAIALSIALLPYCLKQLSFSIAIEKFALPGYTQLTKSDLEAVNKEQLIEVILMIQEPDTESEEAEAKATQSLRMSVLMLSAAVFVLSIVLFWFTVSSIRSTRSAKNHSPQST